MLSPRDALDAVHHVLSHQYIPERERLDRLHRAMKPDLKDADASVEIPNDAPPAMKRIARKSQTNYMPLVVDTFGQVMKVDGYYSSARPNGVPSDERLPAWDAWQRNRMDARQTGLHRSCLIYGVGYALGLPGLVPGSRVNAPTTELFTPRRLTALYQDEEIDEWPQLALAADRNHLRLIDEEAVYYIGSNLAQPVWQTDAEALRLGFAQRGTLEFIEARPHGVDFCPVVRYRDRQLLGSEEQYGIVEPLLTIQSRIHETTFGMMVAQYLAAFKQRYVLGWIPKSEQEELKAGASRIWYLDKDPDTVTIGELNETDLTRYIDSKNSAIRDMAAIGQLPSTALGVDGISNISAEALAGLESAKDRKTDEITTSLGESHEQLMRLNALYMGDLEGADDYNAEVRWREMTARSFAQTVDGLVKLVTGLGLPPEIALEDIPNMTDSKIARIRLLMEERRAAESASAGAPTPGEPGGTFDGIESETE